MKGKNISTLIAVCLYFFFSGVEYAVILPTLNLYLIQMNAEQFFIGLVMSAYSVGGLISAPIYGRLTDKTASSKAAVMISNLFEIAGNVLYFVAKTPTVVLFSRFLAGIGSGSGSSILGMISRSTTHKQRTAAFSLLMSLRQFGLLIGPAFNLFLKDAGFHIGSLNIDALRIPGFFMAIVWTFHLIVMAVGYFELPTTAAVKEESGYDNHNENINNEAAENGMDNERNCDFEKSDVVVKESKSFWKLVYKDLFREEVIVCLFINFVLMFLQTSGETLLTPLTLQLFDWKESANSIFFSAIGAVVIVSFITVGLLSKRLSDRFLLLIGSIIMCLLSIYFLVYITFASKNLLEYHLLFALFIIHTAVYIFDLPFIWVPQASLFSKITSAKSQAFNQGIRMLVMRLGQILGPLWSGSLLQRLPLMASVNLVLILLLTVMIAASYKRLVPIDTVSTITNGANEPDEKTPLLQNSSHINS